VGQGLQPTTSIPGLSADVAKMAVDPRIPTAAISIAWALVPEVAATLAAFGKGPDAERQAYISTRRAASLCGIGSDALRANVHHVPGLVVVQHGTKWKLRESREGGFATSWWVSGVSEPATLPDDPRVSWDSRCLGKYLHPGNRRWSRSEMGPSAWRLLIALLVTRGMTEVTVSGAQAAALLEGTGEGDTFKPATRVTGNRALAVLGKEFSPLAETTPQGRRIHLGKALDLCSEIWDRVDANEDRQNADWDERKEWLRLHEKIKKRQEEAEKAVEAARNGENVPEVGPAGSEPADGHAAAEPQPDEARIETRVGLAQLSWI